MPQLLGNIKYSVTVSWSIGNCSASEIVIRDAMRADLETLFKALADRTRLRLIHLLGDEALCVCDCVEVLKTNQPKISRHLAYLRRAGLAGPRPDGSWTSYRLVEPADPHAAKILQELRETLSTSQTQHRDLRSHAKPQRQTDNNHP